MARGDTSSKGLAKTGEPAAPVGLLRRAWRRLWARRARRDPPARPGAPAVPAGVPGGAALARVCAEALDRCHTAIRKRVESVNETTSREVLAAGSELGEIVLRAQNQVATARGTLDGLSRGNRDDDGFGALITRQGAMTKEHLAAMRSMLSEQAGVAKEAIEALSSIASIGSQVGKISQRTRILALNASVEAARLGAQGVGIKAIATEMRALTSEVNRANTQVEQMAHALLATLPVMIEQTRRMHDTAETFAQELASNVERVGRSMAELRVGVSSTLATGDRELGSILMGSHRALSHLQFQDPVAQSLLIIDSDLEQLKTLVATALERACVTDAPVPGHDELAFECAEHHRAERAGEVSAFNDAAASAEPGEVVLF